MYEYTIKGNTVAVVTDGTAVLGLGNIGAEASIPVMEGKAALFKSFAGINGVPIALDTTDTQEIIKQLNLFNPTMVELILKIYQLLAVLKLKKP